MKKSILSLLIAVMATANAVRANIQIDGNFSDWDSVPAGNISATIADTVSLSTSLYCTKWAADSSFVALYLECINDASKTRALTLYLNSGAPAPTNSYWSLTENASWPNATSDLMIYCEINDFQNAMLYQYQRDASIGWNMNQVDFSGATFASDIIILPNGHAAMECAFKKSKFPTSLSTLQTGSVLHGNMWEETGILPQITYSYGSHYHPMITVPCFDGVLIQVGLSSGSCGENLTWAIDNDTLHISGSGDMMNYHVGDSASAPWQMYHSAITNIVIDSGATSIGDNAFCMFSRLTAVTIPNTITRIGKRAFMACNKLDSVTLSEGLAIIDDEAFYQCSNMALSQLPGTLDSIGQFAFGSCYAISSVDIPPTVTYIGLAAFNSCNLSAILVENGNAVYDSRNGCNAIIETASNRLIQGCRNSTIPNGIVEIGDRAFDNCTGLTSIAIPNGVTRIGEYAFNGCDSLSSVLFPGSLTHISAFAFASCGFINSIVIPQTVTTLERAAFMDCSRLESVALPRGLTEITDSLFCGCRMLPAMAIPDSVTRIGAGAFRSCRRLAAITIPTGVTQIEQATFYDCLSLISVNIPEGVETVADWAFGNPENSHDVRTEIAFPNSVKTMGEYTIANCSILVKITLGSGLQKLEKNALYRCRLLQSITCYAQEPPALPDDYNLRGQFPSYTVLYVPAGSISAYRSHRLWGRFDILPIPGTAVLPHATTWHCVDAYYDFPAQALTNFTAVTYSLQGDTVFGGTTYQTLRRGDGVYCGALRWSADGQQVFYRPGELGGQYSPSKGKEYLLYDFSVSVGDTVYAYDGFMDTSCEGLMEPGDTITPAWVVLSIDTIDGRKHVKVKKESDYQAEWIEGIGTCNILFSRTMHCLTGYDSYWTLCAADSEGNILYSYDVDHLGIHNECPSWKLIDEGLKSSPASNSRIRKFLLGGQLLIQTPIGTFNARGQRIE